MKNPLRYFASLFAKAPKGEMRDATGWDSWAPSQNLSGVQVTPQTALSLTAVYACVTVIAENIASLPFMVYKRLPNGGRIPDPEHPRYDILQFEPSEEVSAFGFWSTIVGDACLHGNGYAEIERDPYTYDPIALHLLIPQATRVVRHTNGQVVYETRRTDQEQNTGRPAILLQENVLHIALFGPNGIAGYSPIELAREAIGVGMAAEKTGAAAFGQSSTPLGYLEVPGELDDQGRKNLREYWNKIHQGPFNAAKVAILEDGTKFVPLVISLETLQYIETRKLTAKQVCQLYKVPPHKAGILDEATYSNIEEQDLDFYKSTLRLWCARIEAEAMRKLFTRSQRKTHFCEFNMNVILRGNSIARTDNLVKLFGAGVFSVNGACLEAGVNPIGGTLGAQRFVQSNLVKLEAPTAFVPATDPNQLPSVPEAIEDPEPAL